VTAESDKISNGVHRECSGRKKSVTTERNPSYTGGSYSSMRLISISYASAKKCKGNDSTAQKT